MTCAIRKPYTNLVLAVPHAEGVPTRIDWTKDRDAVKERDRWTDWLADELFFSQEEDVVMVRGNVSRLDCDLERMEGEIDRPCPFQNFTNAQGKASPSFSNRMLSEWFRYRADVLEAASLGEHPLIVDCHSFPEDLAPDVDVCIGFNDDASRPPQDVLDELARVFRKARFTVAFNRPCANALSPVGYQGQSVMIEVNKRCYLRDDRKKGAHYVKLRNCLRRIYKVLLGRHERDDAADCFPSFAVRDQKLYTDIRSCEEKIKSQKGCRTRFEKALKGARELMCYLHWLGEDSSRRTDPGSLAYGRSLSAWLSPLEICYVMQYELDERNLHLLRSWLAQSVQHQCRPEMLAKVSLRMSQFGEYGDIPVEEILRKSPAVCFTQGMMRCVRVNSHKFLSGEGWTAAEAFHPWHGQHCQWFNRYERLYVFRDLFAEGALVYSNDKKDR